MFPDVEGEKDVGAGQMAELVVGDPDVSQNVGCCVVNEENPADAAHHGHGFYFVLPSVDRSVLGGEGICEGPAHRSVTTKRRKVDFVQTHAVPLEGVAAGEFGKGDGVRFGVFLVLVDFRGKSVYVFDVSCVQLQMRFDLFWRQAVHGWRVE
mgnify:CR=1 FL=1